MIRFEEVSKSYSSRLLLDNISFNLSSGERCGFVGRNGSGKSTLLRLLTNEETADSGEIIVPKDYRLGYLQQHITFSEDSVLKEACLALPSWDRDSTYKAERVLFGLGFKESDMGRSPEEFSGGYNWRIHLAKVLISAPDCLLLDEPSNFLDIVSLRWLERFLRSWQGESIVISHDREFLNRISNHTLGLHRNNIYKVKGGTEELFERILLDEEVYERTRQKVGKKRAVDENYIRRFGAKATKASQAQSRMKKLARTPALDKLSKMHDLNFRFHYSPYNSHRVLDVKDVNFAYENMDSLIESLSFSAENGQRIAFIGKNGRGKTTILKLIAGELRPDSGAVNISESVKIGYFGQTNINRLNLESTVEDEIALANSSLSYGEVRKICGMMMFSGDDAKKKISVLSGGERSRVLLGKILACECNLLLLDEPTHHLDIESVEALVNAINGFSGTVILVTHSELILEKMDLTQLVICRSSGQKVFNGDYDYFLCKEGWGDEQAKPKKEKKKREIKLKTDKQVSAKEKEIFKLEVEVEEICQKLSIEKDREKFTFLSKTLSQKKKDLDQKFNELEKLM